MPPQKILKYYTLRDAFSCILSGPLVLLSIWGNPIKSQIAMLSTSLVACLHLYLNILCFFIRVSNLLLKIVTSFFNISLPAKY